MNLRTTQIFGVPGCQCFIIPRKSDSQALSSGKAAIGTGTDVSLSMYDLSVKRQYDSVPAAPSWAALKKRMDETIVL